MSLFETLRRTSAFRVAAVAVFALGAGITAPEALTVTLTDNRPGGDGQVVWGGPGVNAVVESNLGFGGFSFALTSSFQGQHPPYAFLSLDVSLVQGAGDLSVVALSDPLTFDEGPFGPLITTSGVTLSGLFGNFGGSRSASIMTEIELDGAWHDLASLGGVTNAAVPVVDAFAGMFDFTSPIRLRNTFDFRGTVQTTFLATSRTEVVPIPLPAAGWLLLGGLGALIAVGRRRKAAA